MGQHTKIVNDADFASIIDSDTPTLVDFWAEWCGPCKMMNGPLEELAEENAGKLTIAKLNIDENPGTASAYSVMSIPTYSTYTDIESWEKKTEGGIRMTFLPTIDKEDEGQVLLKGRILFSEKLDDEIQTVDGSNYMIPVIQVADIPVHTRIKDGATVLLYDVELALSKEEKDKSSFS